MTSHGMDRYYQMDIISDIDLEYYNEPIDFDKILPRKSEILAAIGDICRLHQWNKIRAFFDHCCRNYKVVIYVLGNHEFHAPYNDKGMRINELKTKLRIVLKEYPRVYLLDDSAIQIGNSIIHGSTLWSQVTDEAKCYLKPMYLTSCKYGVSTHEWNELHRRALISIRKSIMIARYWGHDLILLTHYAPTFRGTIEGKYRDDPYNRLYCTELSPLFAIPEIKVWVFGHTGYNCDYYMHGTRIVSNQYKTNDQDRVPGTLISRSYDPDRCIVFR